MEATTGAWHRALGIGVALLGLAPRWMEMAQEVQKHTFDERGFPTDPLDFYLTTTTALHPSEASLLA